MEKLGCYFLHFFYPSHLFLEQKSPFLFELDDIQYAVIVKGHLSSLITNDYDNKIIRIKGEDEKHKHEPEKKK